MSMRNWADKPILSPRGAWTLSALALKNYPSRASYAQNCRISPGKVASRPGTSAVFSSVGKVTGMYNWISPSDNFVIYQDGSTIQRREVSSGTTAALLSSGLTGTRAPSIADEGPRLYFCGYDTNGNGTIQARVHDGASATDTCFRAPLTFSAITPSDGGAGLCTQGLHNIAFVFQSRSGFAGYPSSLGTPPTFTPAAITLSSGNRTISVAITLTTPADAGTGSALYLVMSPVNNPAAYYFVTGVEYLNVPASTPGWTQTFTVSMSDEDLVQQDPVENYFNFLTQDGSGNGPITPNFVSAYGRRMTYGGGTQVYVSEIDNEQQITADFNVISLPSNRQIAYGFQLGTDYILTGNKWTGKTRDSGELPSQWEQPQIISEAIGSPFPGCVETKTAGGYAWMAAETGVYLFDGTGFSDKPITYFWGDYWARVNWAAAYAIQIADDVTNQRVYVGVPLDAATECSHQFVIDYTNGITFDSCDITLDIYSWGTFSALRMVKETTGNRSILWIGPSAAGSVAQSDTTTHNDLGTAINTFWKSGYIRDGEVDRLTVRVGGCHYWIRGNGTLLRTWAGLDGTPSLTPPGTITLASAPGKELFDRADLSQVENFTIQVGTNAVDGWFELSQLKPYMRPTLSVR